MNIRKYRPILELSVISVVIYLIHKLFFFLNVGNPKYENLYYPLETVYVFFFACSAVILFILIKVKEQSIENVGYVFMLVTCVKMGVSFVLLRPLLHSTRPYIGMDKVNFFVVFAVFLALETVVTIRILNNRQ